ncbi:MAG: hypothetical protein ACYTG0_18505 [Planctomycetota bacterium]
MTGLNKVKAVAGRRREGSSRSVWPFRCVVAALGVIGGFAAVGPEGTVANAQEPVGFRCALRITVDRKDTEYKSSVGTAVLVRYPSSENPDEEDEENKEDVFLVTAYHVIYQTTRGGLEALGESRYRLGEKDPEDPAARAADFLPGVYIDSPSDLAVFRFTKERSREILEEMDVLIAAPLLQTTDASGVDPSVGLTAVAVGNPKVLGFRPLNIVYSATVSEQARMVDRVPEVARTREAKRKVFLFLETLSVNKGFSGGPVLVPHSVPGQPSQALAGIILGGNPNIDIGRFAWAATSKDVKMGIEALSGAGGPNVHKYSELVSGPPQDWPPISYKWGRTYAFHSQALIEKPTVGKEDWENLKRELLREAKMGEYEETAQSDSEPDEEAEGTCHIQGVEFVFDQVTFEQGVSFEGDDLSNATFLKCTFIHPSFEDAVFNGTRFENCRFIVEDMPDEGILDDAYGKPLMAYGVTVARSKIVKCTDETHDACGRPVMLWPYDAVPTLRDNGGARQFQAIPLVEPVFPDFEKRPTQKRPGDPAATAADEQSEPLAEEDHWEETTIHHFPFSNTFEYKIDTSKLR